MKQNKYLLFGICFLFMAVLAACVTVKPEVRKKPPKGDGWRIYRQGYNYQESSFSSAGNHGSSSYSSYNVVLEGSPQESQEQEKAEGKRNIKDVNF